MTKVHKFVDALKKVIEGPITMEVRDCAIAQSCIAFDKDYPITRELLIELDKIDKNILVSSLDFGNGKVTVLTCMDDRDPKYILDLLQSQ